MKWKNRLQSVLTENRKPEFSKECLETELRKAVKTPINLVSAVNRSGEFRHSLEKLNNPDEPETQSTLVSAVNHSSVFRDLPENNAKLVEIKTDYFHTYLNQLIEKGITFDVSEDDFLFIDKEQNLKLWDMEFLGLNNAAILCHLQQSLLMKHLFSHSPEQFEDFAFEIMERESINTPLRITDKTRFEIYFEAVKSTTRKWFAELLGNKQKKPVFIKDKLSLLTL